jgi:hypothetical protein
MSTKAPATTKVPDSPPNTSTITKVQSAVLIISVVSFVMLVVIVVLVCVVSNHVVKIMRTPEYITKFILSLLGKGSGGAPARKVS